MGTPEQNIAQSADKILGDIRQLVGEVENLPPEALHTVLDTVGEIHKLLGQVTGGLARAAGKLSGGHSTPPPAAPPPGGMTTASLGGEEPEEGGGAAES